VFWEPKRKNSIVIRNLPQFRRVWVGSERFLVELCRKKCLPVHTLAVPIRSYVLFIFYQEDSYQERLVGANICGWYLARGFFYVILLSSYLPEIRCWELGWVERWEYDQMCINYGWMVVGTAFIYSGQA
jgi:hypothetical protein